MIGICVLGLLDVNKPQRYKLHHKFSLYKFGHQWLKKYIYRLQAKNLPPTKEKLLPGREKPPEVPRGVSPGVMFTAFFSCSGSVLH
jgi:hypothetical protein